MIFKLCLIVNVLLLSNCNYNKIDKHSEFHDNVAEPKDRDSSYYRSKGFQFFSQYHLAVKCPVILTDISSESEANFNFHYGGTDSDNSFYEIIVIHLPLGYKDLKEEEQHKFEQNFLYEKFSGKSVVTEIDGAKINAVVMEYDHQRGKGKGIAFIFESKLFGFNTISNANLSKKFNSFTNNIVFYKNASSNNKIQDLPVRDIKEFIINTNQIEKTIPSTGSNEVNSSSDNKSPKKKSASIECINCSEYEIEFRNYKWDNSWDGSYDDVSLSSFNIINRSDNTITNIKIKWTVYDPDGAPVNSGTDNLNLALEYIEPNSGKMCYSVSGAHKKGNQTMKLEVVSIDTK